MELQGRTEGIFQEKVDRCRKVQMEKLAGMDVAFETPGLSQICVAVMKANTKLKI